MSTPHETSQRANIILIMTDRQRTDTIAAWGYSHMVTPNLDVMARESNSFVGVLFQCNIHHLPDCHTRL